MSHSVKIDLVTKEGCLPCIRVKRILGDLKTEFPEIRVREVDFVSEEGVAIAVKNSILYPPAVLINGTLLAKGKIMEVPLKEAVRRAARGG